MSSPRPVEIVGGGLAGLSLGLALRRAAVPVTIFEAGVYPRHRVCGEFIAGLDTDTISRLGLDELLADARRHRAGGGSHRLGRFDAIGQRGEAACAQPRQKRKVFRLTRDRVGGDATVKEPADIEVVVFHGADADVGMPCKVQLEVGRGLQSVDMAFQPDPRRAPTSSAGGDDSPLARLLSGNALPRQQFATG